MLSSCVCFGKTDYEFPLFVGRYKSQSIQIWCEIVNSGRLVWPELEQTFWFWLINYTTRQLAGKIQSRKLKTFISKDHIPDHKWIRLRIKWFESQYCWQWRDIVQVEIDNEILRWWADPPWSLVCDALQIQISDLNSEKTQNQIKTVLIGRYNLWYYVYKRTN